MLANCTIMNCSFSVGHLVTPNLLSFIFYLVIYVQYCGPTASLLSRPDHFRSDASSSDHVFQLLRPAKFLFMLPKKYPLIFFFFDITFSCLFPFCQQKITFQSKSHPTLYPHSRPQYKQTGFELGKISVVVVCCPHVISRRVPITSWVRYGSIRHFPAPWWASQLPLESWVFHPRGLDSGALIPMGQFLREWPVNPRLGHPLDDGRSTSLPSQGGEY